MVEESHSGAKQYRRRVNVDFIEESGIQALLLDGVGAVTPMDFPASAAVAWLKALSMPPLTKWTVESGCGHTGCVDR